MKRIPAFLKITVALSALIFCNSLPGQDAKPASLFDSPVTREDLDRSAFTQWLDGKEDKVLMEGKEAEPARVIWTRNSRPEWNGVSSFADGKTLGPRHLRIGFTKAIQVGTVMTAGNCRVGVLKPDAAYPGDIADDSQWLPAERIAGDKILKEGQGFLLWILPPNTQTRAIRFTHEPKATDRSYAGSLGGVCLFSGRFANLAPQARIMASVNENKVGVIANEWNNCWGEWDNWNETNPPKPVAEQAPWLMFIWQEPVTISGLAAVFGGFGAAEVQTFAGPKDKNPAEAVDTDWKLVKAFSDLQSWYPLQLPVQMMDFGTTVTTKAIRIRMTKVAPESHPHITGNTKKGLRVWVDDMFVLRPLGADPLSIALPKKIVTETVHPPIPVNFKLKEAGYATIVIEDANGKRIRNLVSETPFPAGDNIAWWDGMDDVGRDPEAARHGLYHVPGVFVAPGTYKVRGLSYKSIDLFYEFPVYTAGNPAWNTADNTGAWLSNHTPPCCTLFVPANRNQYDKDLIYIGSHVSEGTHGLAWVDLDGKKVGGINWIGGHWTGAQFLALDSGAKADTNTVLFVGSNFEGELRLTAMTRNGEKSVFKIGKKEDGNKYEMAGLAARDGMLVCSLSKSNKLIFVDVATGKQIGEAAITEPLGITFDTKGNLLVISEKKVLRYAMNNPPPKEMAKPEILVAKGLDQPVQLTVDDADTMFISDRGTSHQIKIFTAAGKQMRSIGKAGLPKAGPYDPMHMNNPAGLTIDNKGRLWVTEQDEYPKRVSVWQFDGVFVNAFYGPAEYGGGGMLDPQDKTLFYYKGMEFKLDWDKGTNKLTKVYWRPEAGTSLLPDGYGCGGAPQHPVYANGKKYFTNCHDSNPTNGAGIVMVWIEKDGLAKMTAAVGRANDWGLLKSEPFKKILPEGLDLKGDYWKNQSFCIWTDKNDDGQPQPEEVKIKKASPGGVTIMPDLSALVSRIDGKTTLFKAAKFSPGGTPLYDFDAGEVLATDVQGPASSGGDQAIASPDGWTVLTAVPKPYSQLSVAGVYKGEAKWSYPDPWPGLHPSHEAQVPDRPGMLIGTTRLLGDLIKPLNSDAGPLWCVNGNMGPMYLMSVDGLFVASLFKDVRVGTSWSMPVAQRGMKLNDVSPHDENFWPSITQTKDGKVYIVDGGRTSLVRVDGLETIQRLPDSEVKVTEADLKKAQEYFAVQEIARQAAQGRKNLLVAIPKTAPVVDGKLDEWKDSDWASVDKRGTAANFNSNSKPYDVQAAAMISGDRLYLAYRTADKDILRNSGEKINLIFKTGGALDLMIATNPSANPKRTDPVAGDLRLLVAKVKDKPVAVLYRAVVPGTAEKDRVPFSSPWRTTYIDKVEDVSDQVQLAGVEGDFEVSIPLKVLGLNPVGMKRLKADIGVLRGDGFQTLQRVYWSNKATGITADIPSEAMLSPNLWGEWEFKTK
ncbi:MAG TPA: hypothetical protein DCZ94_11985 [Lentisphaeria bacterium]|nr:MAG: hypothetical protein A2X48_09420 [Lentisphaerae bacterium GWF2_49_21]HBC87668.1 hypothetical protein [Lentisphaeria bacterium]